MRQEQKPATLALVVRLSMTFNVRSIKKVQGTFFTRVQVGTSQNTKKITFVDFIFINCFYLTVIKVQLTPDNSNPRSLEPPANSK